MLVNSSLTGTGAFPLNPFCLFFSTSHSVKSKSLALESECCVCCLWYLGHFSKSLVIYSTLPHSPFPICSAIRHQIAGLGEVCPHLGSLITLPINIPMRDFASSCKWRVLPSAQSKLSCSYRYFLKHLSDLRHSVLDSVSTHYYISLVKSFGRWIYGL